MNSLEELNAFGRSKIVFTDDRPYAAELVTDDSGTESRAFNEDVQTVLNGPLNPLAYEFNFQSLDSDTANHAVLEIDLSNGENMNELNNRYEVTFPSAPNSVEYVSWEKEPDGTIVSYNPADQNTNIRTNVWAATKIQTESDLLNIFTEVGVALIDRTDPITVSARIIYPPTGNQPVSITNTGVTVDTTGTEIIGDGAFLFGGETEGSFDRLETDRPLLPASDDFTVEFYMLSAVIGDTGTQSQGLLGQGGATGTRLVQNPNGSLEFFVSDSESVSTLKPYSGDASSFISWSASVTTGSTDLSVTSLSGANIVTGELLFRSGDLIRVADDREYVVAADVVYPGSTPVTVGLTTAAQEATGSYSITPGVGAIQPSTWTHIAIVSESNQLTMYVDGRARESIARTASTNQTSNTTVGSAANTAGPDPVETGYPYSYNGELLEIRISNTARYSSEFTPHTTAHEPDVNSLLLLHPAAPQAAPYSGSSGFLHDYPTTVIEKQYNITLTGSPEVTNLTQNRIYNYGQTTVLFPDNVPEIVDVAVGQRYDFTISSDFGVNFSAPGNSVGTSVAILNATRTEVEAWLPAVSVVSSGTEPFGGNCVWSLRNDTNDPDDYTSASGSFTLIAST